MSRYRRLYVLVICLLVLAGLVHYTRINSRIFSDRAVVVEQIEPKHASNPSADDSTDDDVELKAGKALLIPRLNQKSEMNQFTLPPRNDPERFGDHSFNSQNMANRSNHTQDPEQESHGTNMTLHSHSSVYLYRQRTLPTLCAQNLIKDTGERFILGWLFFEQITMATNNMFTLMWYAKVWRSRAVMPFTYGSRLYGLPHVWFGQKKPVHLHPLQLIYDMSKLDELVCKFDLPPLADFGEFLEKASRSIVVIHYIYQKDDLTRFHGIGGSRKTLLEALRNNHIIDCCSITYISKIVTRFHDMLNDETNYSGFKHFEVNRCLCVNASLPTEPDDLLSKINLPSSKFTVVFSDWRGIASIDVPKKAPQGILRNFRMLVPSFRKHKMPHPSRNALPLSSDVKKNATQFLYQLTEGQPFIAVHYRSEKLGQVEKRIPNYIDVCFQKSLEVKDTLLSESTKVLYFSDYGSYGSNTCHNDCRGARHLDTHLFAKNIKLTHFTPSKYNAVPDSGFVAFVEQEIIASAEALVMVGGGSFQSQILRRFKEYKKHIAYIVCWDDTATFRKA